jgi:hypothetical protein
MYSIYTVLMYCVVCNVGTVVSLLGRHYITALYGNKETIARD